MPTFVLEDRWKLASHIQKAVRRGLVEEAEWGVRELWPLDNAYLRARLAVIAVEDVAGASDGVVLEHFGPGWNKRALDARGGVEAVVKTARALAEAEKDRTACEFWSCRHWIKEFEARNGRWSELTVPEAIGLAWDPQETWWARGLGAWRAVGTKAYSDRSEALPSGVAGDPAMWAEACSQESVHADRAKILLTAGKAQGEPHPIFLPLAWSLRDAQLGQPARAPRPNIDLGKVGPWLSAALDGHTAEGRAALRRMLFSNSAGKAFLTAHGRVEEGALRAVGKLWFMMEGGWCANMRSYPAADQMGQDIRVRFLETPQPMNGHELYRHFGDSNVWQVARQEVMQVPLTPRRPRP